MPQVLSSELIHYMTCCADGQAPVVIPTGLKYLFESTGLAPLNIEEIITDYTTGEFDVSTIETDFGVGTPAVQEVIIAYCNNIDFLIETIFVDTTSSATFWNDIIGWLFLNNFYDITYDAGLDKWLINDPLDLTYIEMIKQ